MNGDQGANPHLWYDPATMPKVASAVADALVQGGDDIEDLAALDLAENFVGIDAGFWDLVRFDAPHLGDVSAVFRVPDIARAR